MPFVWDQLKMTPAAAMTAGGTQSVFQSTAGSNLVMNAPGSNRLSGERFSVVASGYVSGGAGTYTATIQPILYGDASLATVTTKPLFSATAGTLAYTGTAAAGLTIPWTLKAELFGDATAATLTGNCDGSAGATYKIKTQIVAPVSTITFATEPPVKFAVGMTSAGTLGAAPKFVIEKFALEQV